MRRLIATAITALVLTAGLTACTDTDTTGTKPAPSPAAQHSPKPEGDTAAPAAAGNRTLTKSSFDIAWGVYTTSEKDTVCSGYDLLGPAAAQDAMSSGVEDKSLMDWAYFTQLVGKACDAR